MFISRFESVFGQQKNHHESVFFYILLQKDKVKISFTVTRRVDWIWLHDKNITLTGNDIVEPLIMITKSLYFFLYFQH